MRYEIAIMKSRHIRQYFIIENCLWEWRMRSKIKYHLRWHILLVHFPISLFGVAFLFQILHLFFSPACFTLSTTVVILLGAIAMIPTTSSGWSTWKHKYKGSGTFLFQRKIVTAFVMLGISILLITWRLVYYNIFSDEPNIPHWIFMAGTMLLIIGAIIEGYYGGKLTHRD
jgi:uncharacterized membrane protein